MWERRCVAPSTCNRGCPRHFPNTSTSGCHCLPMDKITTNSSPAAGGSQKIKCTQTAFKDKVETDFDKAVAVTDENEVLLEIHDQNCFSTEAPGRVPGRGGVAYKSPPPEKVQYFRVGRFTSHGTNPVTSWLYLLISVVGTVDAQSISTSTGLSTSAAEEIPQALIVVLGISMLVIIGAIISKCVDYCHDRKAISDDASDISEYTRELLKSQMMLLMFNRNRKRVRQSSSPEEIAVKFAKVWRAKTARNRARRLKQIKKDLEALEESVTNKSKVHEHKTVPHSPPASVATVNETSFQNGPTSGSRIVTPPTGGKSAVQTRPQSSFRAKSSRSVAPGGVALKK